MSEPRRLHEDFHAQVEHALLEAGRAYRASHGAHAKTLAALGLTTSVALSATSAAAASSTEVAKVGWAVMGWAKYALSISALGAIAAPAAYLAWPGHQAVNPVIVANTPSSSVATGADVRPSDVVTGGLALSNAGSTRSPQAEERTPAVLRGSATQVPSVGGQRSSVRSTSKGAPSVALGPELAMVEAARSVLSNGDPRSALAVLDTYSRMYPRGHLEIEAEVLRMDALAKSGQPGAAAKHAEAFLRRHPNSVLASRARSFLAD